MTKQQFIRNNQGINGGDDLPVDYQEDIYYRIVNDEIMLSRYGPCSIVSKMQN